MLRPRILRNIHVFSIFKVDNQAKNLLIMGEREQQLQDLVHLLRTTVEKSPQHEAQLHIYKKELEGM